MIKPINPHPPSSVMWPWKMWLSETNQPTVARPFCHSLILHHIIISAIDFWEHLNYVYIAGIFRKMGLPLGHFRLPFIITPTWNQPPPDEVNGCFEATELDTKGKFLIDIMTGHSFLRPGGGRFWPWDPTWDGSMILLDTDYKPTYSLWDGHLDGGGTLLGHCIRFHLSDHFPDLLRFHSSTTT